MDEHGALILPPGVSDPRQTGDGGRGMIVNESDLPDHVVHRAVETFIEENASVLGVNAGNTFQTYANNSGSLLARARFRTPGSVWEEIQLARDMAERDDDVAATLGSMIATAFEGGMQNVHEDEETVAMFNKVAKLADLDSVFPEMYRELLIASSVTTVHAFTRESVQFQPEGADRQRTRGLTIPKIGVLPAEQIFVLDNDIFRTGRLAYRPATSGEEMWLDEFFNPDTSAGRKSEMRKQDPLLTSLLLERIELSINEPMPVISDQPDPPVGRAVYRLNPRMIWRSTFPKGAWKYPRPLLTRNFPLLEAKRLLNLMDYALLQGGSNFLVVAKKGTDQRPALPEEVTNLHETIRRASRTGVIIGDHRLDIQIITPELKELLNPEKRRLLGRKLAMALMRVPESGIEEPGAEGMRAEVEFVSRVIQSDRRILRRHVEGGPYEETVTRNPGDFPKGAANIWHPKIILQGTQYFTDYILKMRDRGDIPRRYAVEAGGFDYDAAVQQRKREKSRGDDRVMTQPVVPFSGPQGNGPQDLPEGRPRGTSSDNGAPGARQRPDAPARARPTRVIKRTAGETVRAMWDEEHGSYKIGELTAAVLEQYDEREVGRLTAFERKALKKLEAALDGGEWPDPIAEGPVTIVGVNPEYAIEDCKAMRLSPGLSMLVGSRVDDGAIVARAFCFREPEYRVLDAEEKAVSWGFPARPLLENPESAE